MPSIIDEKYKGRYKGAEDWLAAFVDDEVKVKVTKETETTNPETGEKSKVTVETKQTRVDVDALFDLAEENAIDARGKYGDQIDRPNAPGRLRMTVGNMLRAAAKRRHGLFDKAGDWHDAPEEFLHDAKTGMACKKTENPDGSKIKIEKPAAAAAAAAADADADAADTAETFA